MTKVHATIQRIASIAFHETAAAWGKRGQRMILNKEDFQELTAALFGYEHESLYRKAARRNRMLRTLDGVQFVFGKRSISPVSLEAIAEATKVELQKTIGSVLKELRPDIVYKNNRKSFFKGETAITLLNRRLRKKSERARFGGDYAVYPEDCQNFQVEIELKDQVLTGTIKGWVYSESTLALGDFLITAGVKGVEAVDFNATFSLEVIGRCFFRDLRLVDLAPNLQKRRSEAMRAHQPA